MSFAERHPHLVVAATILDQLGGPMFLRMTGSTQLIGCAGYTADEPRPWLRLTIGSHEAGWHRLKVTLLACDEYRMEFTRPSPVDGETEVRVVERIGWEKLQATFTEVTGMDTHL